LKKKIFEKKSLIPKNEIREFQTDNETVFRIHGGV